MTRPPPAGAEGPTRGVESEPRDRRARLVVAFLVAGVGLLAGSIEVVYALRLETLLARFLEAVVPLAVSVSLVVAGALLFRSDLPWDAVGRLLAWFVGGTMGFAGIAGWQLAHASVSGGHLHDWEFMLVHTATMGGLVGFTIGWYDARAWMDRMALGDERRIVERERARMAFINRLLRHHVLNGMNVIKGNADRLEGRVDATAQPHLATVRDRSAEVAGLVNRVRSLMDVITDGGTASRPYDLRPAVEDAVEGAVPEAVKVEVAVPAASVRGDERLTTALEALLSAAVRNSEDGSLAISAAVEGRTVTIRIRTGESAIPCDAADWETVDPKDGSTDVDVAIADAITADYEGSLRIEEQPDGVAFVLELPLAE